MITEESWKEQVAELQDENKRLRAALATSPGACVYCQLPRAEWLKCRGGFPGCDRADDVAGCPEFGAMMELGQFQEALKAVLDRIDETRSKHPDVLLRAFATELENLRRITNGEVPPDEVHPETSPF